MSTALTTEQIELLRGLPTDHSQAETMAFLDADWDFLNRHNLIHATEQVKGGTKVRLSHGGAILLATLDAERERVLTRVSDELRSWERRDLDKGREAAAWGFQDFRDWVDAQRGATDA